MKKYLSIIAVLLIGSFQYSCNEDLLELQQHGVQNTTDVYTNADDETAESLIAAIYNLYTGSGFVGSDLTYRIVMNTLSDDGLSGATFSDGANTHQLFNKYQTTSETSTYKDLWSSYYQVIYWCNMIVERLPDDSDVKMRVIAEAKAVRAITMMTVVRLWGNPPLVSHILSENELSMPNTPAEQSWAWIESQLEEAAPGLPSKNGLDGQAAIGGRLTKEAAYAYLGKAQLFQGKYSEAANTLKTKVMDTELYGLIDNFDDLNHATSDFCKEYLWEYNLANDPETNDQQGDMRAVWYGYRAEYIISPDELTGGWGYGAVSADFGEFFESHELRSDNTLSPRYHASIATYEELLDESRWHYTTLGNKGVFNPPLQNNQGYFRLKHMGYVTDRIPGSPFLFFFRQYNNISLMRYAEVLLMYAEATVQQGNQEGLDAFNAIRTRAGLPTVGSYSLNDLKEEKRAELFFEGERFLDLVRWGDAADLLKDKGKVLYAFHGYLDGTTNIQDKAHWYIETFTTGSDGFVEGKNEVFPYPLVEIQSNLNLVQNLGGW